MTNNVSKDSGPNPGSDPEVAAPAAATAATTATSTMLNFANPPKASTAAAVAAECSQEGFATIGITNVLPTDVIDFSRFDQQSCTDLGDAIVLCVDVNGFSLPALGGTFDIMRVQGTQITFDNFVKAVTVMMKPKVTG
jgi:hypothetical protein